MDVDEQLPTARFRRQHGELFQLAEQILALCGGVTPVPVQEIRTLMARFLGKLKIHAAMENDALYPRLLKDPDERVRETAQRLFKDVGPIYEEVFVVEQRWPDVASGQRDPAAFVKDIKRVLRRLGERVMLETAELYPLVDQRP